MSTTAWLVVSGAGAFVLGMTLMIRHAYRNVDRPVPSIDRSRTYTATVRYVRPPDDGGGTGVVMVDYEDADGETRRAGLGDVIHDSWIDRFEEGSRWQVHAYDPPGPRVVLTEVHDEVWRCGWNLDGVHIGGQSGPVDPGPGSPFRHRPRRYGS